MGAVGAGADQGTSEADGLGWVTSIHGHAWLPGGGGSPTIAHSEAAGAAKAEEWVCPRSGVCWGSGTAGAGAEEWRALSSRG